MVLTGDTPGWGEQLACLTFRATLNSPDWREMYHGGRDSATRNIARFRDSGANLGQLVPSVGGEAGTPILADDSCRPIRPRQIPRDGWRFVASKFSECSACTPFGPNARVSPLVFHTSDRKGGSSIRGRLAEFTKTATKCKTGIGLAACCKDLQRVQNAPALTTRMAAVHSAKV
jgi:hypothetical protein